MSTSRRFDAPAAAQVIDLSVARQRPVGDRGIARLSDGRRKGDHGNRMSPAMRAAIIAQLEDVLELRGEVTTDDKRAAARAAGVHLRSINRLWEKVSATKLAALRDPASANQAANDATGQAVRGGADGTGAGGCVDSCQGHDHGRGCRAGLRVGSLPGWLYKFNETERLQLTADEIEFFARHVTILDAIEAVRANPQHRLRHYGVSTLYAAWANVSEPVRIGARYGATRQRAGEATYPLSGTEAVNETWSIDEYDLKLNASHLGVLVQPKLLVVRERVSGLPLAKLVLPRAATGADTGTVLAAAAIGYTVAHPFDSTEVLRVSGVARYLHTDQGGSFLGEPGAAAARRLGIGLSPIPSHQPQANGDHEVMHQSLLRHFADGPGSRRGWTDRAGNRLDHGVLPFDAVVEEVDHWFATYLETTHTKGDRRGMSRLEVYADAVDHGEVYTGHTLTAEDEAALATVLGDRRYDATRGIYWDNRYWLSRELAGKAVNKQKLVIAQLLNPDVLYVFDVHGKFLAIVTPRDEPDAADQHGLYMDRARREDFVERAVGSRATHARIDAAAIWDETADHLASAAEDAAEDAVRAMNQRQRRDDRSHNLSAVEEHDRDHAGSAAADPSQAPQDGAEGPSEPVADASWPSGTVDSGLSDDSSDRRSLVRAARRRRTPPAPVVEDVAALEAEAEALARRLEAARAKRHADRGAAQPTDGSVDEPTDARNGGDDAS